MLEPNSTPEANQPLVMKTPEELVEDILPDIKKIAGIIHAKNYWARSVVTVEDLIQEGAIGALQAAKNYNPDMSSFKTYAKPAIEGRMKDKYRRRNYETFFIEKNAETRQSNRAHKIRGNRTENNPELFDAKSLNHAQYVELDYHREMLEKVFTRLTPQEATVLRKHYFEDETQASISRSMGIGSSRVSEIHNTALKQMREYFQHTGIEPSILHNRDLTSNHLWA